MSKIAWSSCIVPEKDSPVESYQTDYFDFNISQVKKIPVEDSEIAIPDPRAFRLMSRASILLSSVCMRAKEVLDQFVNKDPYSVGIYCAIENGPIDLESTKKMLDVSYEDFGVYYKKFRSPKMYLKQLPNLAPAQMGIFMGIRGPMNVYTHSLFGSQQALEQAELDIDAGVIQAALVCTAFSLESPLITLRASQQREGVLTEGAGAMVLIKDDKYTEWKNKIISSSGNNFGISHDLIHIVQGGI